MVTSRMVKDEFPKGNEGFAMPRSARHRFAVCDAMGRIRPATHLHKFLQLAWSVAATPAETSVMLNGDDS